MANTQAIEQLVEGISIESVDQELRGLFESIPYVRDETVSIDFRAPTPDWAKNERQGPTINCYLYDIRQDLVRKQWGQVEARENKIVVARREQPRWFRLSYFLTAWGDTSTPRGIGQEHDLLTELLRAMVARDSLPIGPEPAGESPDTRLKLPIALGMPPPQDRVLSELWSSLGTELRPSLDLIVSLPIMPTDKDRPGLPTLAPPKIDVGEMPRSSTPDASNGDDESGEDWRTRTRRPKWDGAGEGRHEHVEAEAVAEERRKAAQDLHKKAKSAKKATKAAKKASKTKPKDADDD